MKKFIPFICIVLLIVSFTVRVRTDNTFTAPYDFEISLPTPTSLVVSFSDSNDVAPDSISVVDGSDSTMFEYILPTSTQRADTLNGLTPFKQYDLMLRVLRNDSVHVSNLDTLYTSTPEVELQSVAREYMQMRGARSWKAAYPGESFRAMYDTLYTAGTGDDSTGVYVSAPYTSIQVKGIDSVTGVDSTVCKFLIYPGRAIQTNVNRESSIVSTGVMAFNHAAPDSFTISVIGRTEQWSKPYRLYYPNSQHFYIKADGQTDNGQNVKWLIYLDRRWRWGLTD